MKNGVYRLASGREVQLCRFHLDRTYRGVLEGTLETASKHILKNIREWVEHALPPGEPVVVIDPGIRPLPEFRLIAQLDSRTGVKTKDPDYNSELYACWFVNDVSRNIDDLISGVLPELDWELNARDYDITFI